MTPEITVVIPAYNASRYIGDAINSVCKQTFNNWELIVVNDGSKDNTGDIVNGFLTDSRIKLISQENKGVSAARNTGIKAAKGRFITFLDADDYYLSDNLKKKYEVLINNESIDFVYCDVIQCDDKLTDVRVEKGAETDNLFKKVLQWQGETIPTLPSNTMVKTALMKEKFLFDENLSNCADRYMKIQLAKNAKPGYIPQALVKYRNSPGSMSKNVWLLEHDEEYIAKKIIKDNIVPPGKFRRKVISNMYIIVSGSWYTDAHKPLKAIKYGLKATFIYPPVMFKFIKKLFDLLGKNKKTSYFCL